MIQDALFSELQKLCRRSFPERLEQTLSGIQVEEGGRHPTVSLSLAWREGRRPRVERLIVRRYADPWTWWSADDREKPQREWAVVRWLYGRGLPVPLLYASGADRQDPFLLSARVAGQRPALGGAPDASAYAEALAGLLAQLHRLIPPNAVRKALPQVSAVGELDRLAALAQECNDGELIEAVSELCAREVEELTPCVLHGDPRVANVLCDARGVTALLAWENAALGDPRWDIARTTNDLRSHRAEAFVEPLCAAYRDGGDADLRGLTYWEALTAVQSWTLVEWVRGTVPPEDAAGLLSRRDTVRASAWRALTRLRYESRAHVASSELLPQVNTQGEQHVRSSWTR